MSLSLSPIPFLLLATFAAPQEDEPPPNASETLVREALAEGRYPWYSPETDELVKTRPVRLNQGRAPRSGPFGSGRADLGQLLVFLLMVLAILGLMIYFVRAWQRNLENEPIDGPRRGPPQVVARMGQLPAGVQVDESDPWNAAFLARGRGDLGRATVLIFAHQLLTLERLGMARMLPGRTGRQIVRSVSDSSARRHVEPTLRLFERVYYGQHVPTPAEFDVVWQAAEQFQSWAVERGTR